MLPEDEIHQPLLVSLPTKKDIRRGRTLPRILVPSFCVLAGQVLNMRSTAFSRSPLMPTQHHHNNHNNHYQLDQQQQQTTTLTASQALTPPPAPLLPTTTTATSASTLLSSTRIDHSPASKIKQPKSSIATNSINKNNANRDQEGGGGHGDTVKEDDLLLDQEEEEAGGQEADAETRAKRKRANL